jgi:hypothetical protein
MNKPICTYCGNNEFYQGPEGGASFNVCCTNHKCRHWFNVVLIALEDINRVAPEEGFPINEKYV